MPSTGDFISPIFGFAVELLNVTAFISTLFDHDAPHALIEYELTAMLDFQYDKTANRSLVGMLNQFTYLAEGNRDCNQTTDLRWLSMKLSETPCSPLVKKTISPNRELRRLIEAEWTINAAID